jgi:hypothetical protein
MVLLSYEREEVTSEEGSKDSAAEVRCAEDRAGGGATPTDALQ